MIEEIDSLLCAARDARGIALDAIAAANSGHLGLPMGCAEIGAALFGKCLTFSAEVPAWINRDRFIMSAGHGSIFLYTWLHLAGYDISLNDIKNFRKTGSITPGHPEFNKDHGIECTTGPLGQGIANAVGVAISCKKQAKKFNTVDHKIFDNYVVCLCGDGCLQEGISAEACSLAGHWHLDNFILIFDSNDITLDAHLNQSQSENVVQRFEAYGFEIFQTNGNDLSDFIETFESAKFSKKCCPKLIIAKTTIGYGIDEVAGKSSAHGSAGIKFIKSAKQKLGLPDEKFFLSDETLRFFTQKKADCASKYEAWMEVFDAWKEKNPELVDSLEKNNTIEDVSFLDNLKVCDREKFSTRAAAGEILQTLAEKDEHIITGSADLFSSAGNYIKNGEDFSSENFQGRNIYFGVREHAMAAIMNGIAYDGMFRATCSTFLVFSDYMRAAIRVAALSKLSTIFIFTHDSIAVGEDGPTHQPIETISSLRCIPNLNVIRPADYDETVGAWKLAISNMHGPTALILSRQDLPQLHKIDCITKRVGTQKGAYIIYPEIGDLKRIILSSGSELNLAISAAQEMDGTRVVSMVCMEVFDRQSTTYKDSILPPSCIKRVAIEAGISVSWYKYVGLQGVIISVEDFGFSGSADHLMEKFGITLDCLLQKLKGL